MNDYFINGEYINTDYFKNLLLGNNNPGVFKTNDENTAYKELTYDDLINNFKEILNKENLDSYSPIIALEKNYLLCLLILLYDKKDKADEILKKFFTASSYETREEILFSFMEEK